MEQAQRVRLAVDGLCSSSLARFEFSRRKFAILITDKRRAYHLILFCRTTPHNKSRLRYIAKSPYSQDKNSDFKPPATMGCGDGLKVSETWLIGMSGSFRPEVTNPSFREPINYATTCWEAGSQEPDVSVRIVSRNSAIAKYEDRNCGGSGRTRRSEREGAEGRRYRWCEFCCLSAQETVSMVCVPAQDFELLIGDAGRTVIIIAFILPRVEHGSQYRIISSPDVMSLVCYS